MPGERRSGDFAFDVTHTVSAGRRTALVDPLGRRTSFSYDASGQMIRELDPLLRRTTYGYDSAGRRSFRLDARGVRTTYVHDLSGRLTARKYSDGTRATFAFDALGNRTRMHDATGITTTSYCCPGRPLVVVNPQGRRIGVRSDSPTNRSAQSDLRFAHALVVRRLVGCVEIASARCLIRPNLCCRAESLGC